VLAAAIEWLLTDHNDTPAKGLLIGSLGERAKAGEKKYGTRLKANNGRDALIDAFQEAQDALMYLEQKFLERPRGEFDWRLVQATTQAQKLAIAVAELILMENESGRRPEDPA